MTAVSSVHCQQCQVPTEVQHGTVVVLHCISTVVELKPTDARGNWFLMCHDSIAGAQSKDTFPDSGVDCHWHCDDFFPFGPDFWRQFGLTAATAVACMPNSRSIPSTTMRHLAILALLALVAFSQVARASGTKSSL